METLLSFYASKEVSGTLIPIDTVSLLIAGTETNIMWLVSAMAIAGAGFAIVKLRRK